jgi:hypothetical protein
MTGYARLATAPQYGRNAMKLKMWELVKNLISMIECLERELADAEAEVNDLKAALESSQEDNAQLTLSIVRGINP